MIVIDRSTASSACANTRWSRKNP